MKIINQISKNLPFVMVLLLGFVIGALSALSFLRTVWSDFRPDFSFWISIIMTITSFFFAALSLWQYWEARSEKKKGDAQVKIWMQDAQGLDNAMRMIGINAINNASANTYSSVNDVGLAVYALASSAKGLYQSLYEERCVTEQEYTSQQREIGNAMHKKRLDEIDKSPNPQS